VKRNGLLTFASPAVTFTSVFAAESTPALYLVGAGGTSLYSVGTGGVVTAIKTALTSALRWEFVSAPVVSGQGPVFGMNGTDTPQQWSGATAGTATVNWTNASGAVAVPNGKYCTYHQNQVFVSGVAGFPSRLYWSAIADPTNWDPASNTGAGLMDLDPNDGEAITAIGTVGPYVLVAKPRKIWVLIDPATASTRRISDNVGIVAHRSLAVGPEGTYFLAEDRGVYLTNGTKLTPISDKLQPTIDSVVTRANAAGQYFNGHYYLSVGLSGSTNDTTLDWDATLGSWWRHTIASNQFDVWHPTGTAQLYSAKSSSAIVDQCFVPATYQDNGANFTWYWRGPWQSPTFYRRRRFPTPYFRKRLRQLRVEGSGQVDFSLAKDFTPTETLWKSDVFSYTVGTDNFAGTGNFGDASTVFGGSVSMGQGRFYSLGVARAFSVVMSGTTNVPAMVNEYELLIHDRKDLVVQ